MRHLALLTLATLVAAAPAALACDAHAKTTAKPAADCPHSKPASAAKATSPDDAAVKPAVASAKADCCMGGAKSTTASTRGGDAVPAAMAADCPMAKKAGAGKDCTPSASAREVKASGKVVCERCELKKSAACASVFKPATGDAYYRLCGEGMSAKIQELTKHGELDVTVHGRVTKDSTGAEVLCLEGFSVGTI